MSVCQPVIHMHVWLTRCSTDVHKSFYDVKPTEVIVSSWSAIPFDMKEFNANVWFLWATTVKSPKYRRPHLYKVDWYVISVHFHVRSCCVKMLIMLISALHAFLFLVWQKANVLSGVYTACVLHEKRLLTLRWAGRRFLFLMKCQTFQSAAVASVHHLPYPDKDNVAIWTLAIM